MNKITGWLLLLLALTLGAALRVPGWKTEEEMGRWRLFEVDEEQHIAIAIHRFNDLVAGGDTIRNRFHERSYNVEGYGRLVGNLLYVGYGQLERHPDKEKEDFTAVLMIGRKLSTLFALFLIVVVFALGRSSGLSPPAAGVAALLMAACDVNATYSHYMLPASSYVFFSYLALLGGVRLAYRPSPGSLVLLALGAAGAATFKFDVFPLVYGGALLLFLACRRLVSGSRGPGLPWTYVVGGTALLAFFSWVLLSGWSWEDIQHSFTELRKQNKDVIRVENHFRDNLLAYPLGVLAGIGLPAFGLALWGAGKLLRQHLSQLRSTLTPQRTAVLYVFLFLLTEAALRWYMDTTFIRRVNIFMPAIAILAAYTLQRYRVKPWLTALVVAWSFGLGVVGQSHHWYDTRVAMRDWLNEELPKPNRVGISASINIDGLKNWKYYLHKDWDYFVTSEAFYRRYTKSLTTPFGRPPCDGGIYHGGPADQCEDFQAMLYGEHPGVELHKAFRTWDVFPERLLYHHWFGYYETFLGDVLIFRRTAPPANERTTS